MYHLRKLSVIALALLLSACAASPQPDAAQQPVGDASVTAEESGGIAASTAVSFTDALGQTVTVDRPERVSVVMGSFAETWMLAGGELAGVTQDAYDERSLVLPETVTNLGSMKTPSMELLIALQPDFIILSSKVAEHVALRDTLSSMGVTSAYFEVESFEQYLSMLKICTDITGRADLYEQNGTAVRAQIDAAIAKSEGKPSSTVLYIRAFSTGANAKGSDNMTGAMLRDLGCVNIADSDESLLEDLSMEKIIQEDPDYIFVATMGASSEKALEAIKESYQSNPAWKDLSAVKNDRYIVLPKDLFHYKPNARWGESYGMLADILYGAA